jgi:hypothetical protein
MGIKEDLGDEGAAGSEVVVAVLGVGVRPDDGEEVVFYDPVRMVESLDAMDDKRGLISLPNSKPVRAMTRVNTMAIKPYSAFCFMKGLSSFLDTHQTTTQGNISFI